MDNKMMDLKQPNNTAIQVTEVTKINGSIPAGTPVLPHQTIPGGATPADNKAFLDAIKMNQVIDEMNQNKNDLIRAYEDCHTKLNAINKKVGGQFTKSITTVTSYIEKALQDCTDTVGKYEETLNRIIQSRLNREEEATTNIESQGEKINENNQSGGGTGNTAQPVDGSLQPMANSVAQPNAQGVPTTPPAPNAQQPQPQSSSAPSETPITPNEAPAAPEPVPMADVESITEGASMDTMDTGTVDGTMNAIPTAVEPSFDPGTVMIPQGSQPSTFNAKTASGIGVALGAATLGASALINKKRNEETTEEYEEVESLN